MGPSLDDIIALAQTVLGEASSESDEGQLAVAYVVMNRLLLKPGTFGRTIYEVCHQRLQFSCWNSNDPNCARIARTPFGDPHFITALVAATKAIEGKADDPTKGAINYHTVAAPHGVSWPPDWTKPLTKTAVIGRHVFYRS